MELKELAQDLDRMVDLFTGDLGYKHVPVMGLDPTWLQIQDALRDFCTSPDRQPDDYVTLYTWRGTEKSCPSGTPASNTCCYLPTPPLVT